MNIETFSPALVLLFVCALLWILMDVRFRQLTPVQQWMLLPTLLLLGLGNHLLKAYLGSAAYGPLILLTLHLPVFLLFLRLTGCGIIKMLFMLFSAVVFTAPSILVGNIVRNELFVGIAHALLLSNLFTYTITLLMAQLIFRKGFNYLVKHGDMRVFLPFSLVPALYFVYIFAVMNLDLSPLNSAGGYLVRAMPTVFAFAFYFLLLNTYRELGERRDLDAATAALSQELHAAEEQIALLNQTQMQTAVYQHEMRHHLALISGFLSAGKFRQAEEYVQNVQSDVEAITLKRFCENETVNLLCSSFMKKANRADIRLSVEACLPTQLPLSDTELCSLLANGLENAMHAVGELEKPHRTVSLYCGIRHNKLLIEIKNPYGGKIVMRDGLPVSSRKGHGYGCRNIRTITEQRRGLCSFDAAEGVFTLRVVLPMPAEAVQS